jgi:hypothetical protein
MAKVKKELVNIFIYALTSSISDLFGVSAPAIARRIGSGLLKRAEARKWLPKDFSDPVKALNELLEHYVKEGYCKKAIAERRSNEIVIKCYDIFDYERIESLSKRNRYPCMLLSSLAMAFLSDYFNITLVNVQSKFKLIPYERGSEEILEIVSIGG